MRKYLFVQAAFLGSLACSPAFADCSVSGGGIDFNDETTQVDMRTAAGQECSLPWSIFEPARLVITKITSAANGTTAVNERGAKYAARSGYKGNDAFAVILCGVNAKGSGCTTLKVTVAVSDASRRSAANSTD